MKTKLTWAAVSILLALAGCGSASMASPTTPVAQVEGTADPMTVGMGTTETPSAQAGGAMAEAALDTSTLPEAPWSAERMAMSDAPDSLVRAWEHADNRDTCAPIAPASFGAAAGARARTSELHGGWAVEFDRRGLPGVDARGEPCETCGRGVFGIAGTSLTPEDLVAYDSGDTAPLPTYRDGSYAEMELEGEGEGAAATFTVAGEGCVYQVWSFLGPDHVEELVRELRLVELPASRETDTAVASAD